jgi:mannose-1-phosphate guanylyltransferase
MKAFLLAGGRGERLRPLTLSCPKCLAPIDGEPLLGIWLRKFRNEGIDHVLLNVSHHVDRVREFLATVDATPHVELVVEDGPQGSASTVSRHRSFVEAEESFWVIYADNLTDASLPAMLEAHRLHDELLTIGLFRAPDPTAVGVVEVDRVGRVLSFEEKPQRPRSDLANAGIYLARAGLIDELPGDTGRPADFGLDVLPGLVGRMRGHLLEGFFHDIGTPAALERASAVWASRHQGAGR